MENETLRLTSVLADPTRFAIYQYISSIGRPVNTLEIADKFVIHPNVARLHLNKLEDVNLLKSETEKTGRGGRPSRIYTLSDEVVSLQFPPRDYQLLAKIAIETLLSLGDIGQKALVEMGRNFGREAAKQAMLKDGISNSANLPLDQKLESIERLVIAQGLQPRIEKIDEHTIRFSVNNCIFNETVETIKNHSICQMHHHFLEGIFETYLGDIDLMQESSMIAGFNACQYTVIKLPIE
ncbi:helix-turn-helix transcriptional regulator [Tepidibacillus fermentans]|uniref:Putative ArsR family transcriptional regulator n=1 Tax=Tepidibacillus fermentans TaxID=1281767 RepID=A0A4R3KKU9_9BACI|nr:helix-turn-helix domain-containing protein [Tepidibacillus fermentans]TCS84434.1 putative ArsR family transcriptional regulator [Tepidibacillus fermentans]